MHPRYSEWIQYVFDHPVTEPEWYFDLDAPGFIASDTDYVELIRDTFCRSGDDLALFTDAQVNQGLWYLTSPSGSDYMFSIRDGDVPVEQKVAAILSIYDLYRDCFATRCSETLGHTDEPGASDLNGICYMFWDLCPVSYLEGAGDADELADAIFSVLEDTIRLPHRACIEGGLHGLGDIAHQYGERVGEVIDSLLGTAKLDDTLLWYAKCAREGGIE